MVVVENTVAKDRRSKRETMRDQWRNYCLHCLWTERSLKRECKCF